MKQIFKINYRSIVIFELIYRLIYVVLFQSISVRLINFLLDVYGFSYLNIKNIKGLLLNPLTYPVFIAIILVALLFAGFEIIVLYTGFRAAKEGKRLKLFPMLLRALKRTGHMIKPKNIPLFLLAGGLFYVFESFLIYKLTELSIRAAGIKNALLDIKVFFVLGILIIAAIVVCVIINMFAVCYGIFNNCDRKEALKEGRRFFKGRVLKSLAAYLVGTLIYLICFYLIRAVLMVVMSTLVVIFAADNLEMALIVVISKYIDYILIFFFSIAVCMIYSGITVGVFYNFEPVKNEQPNESDGGNTKLNKRIAVVMAAVLVIGTLYNIIDVVRNGNMGTHNSFEGITITSHRGYSDEAPENTLPALSLAIDSFADYAEIDVRQTKDGVLILMHDASLKRTTGMNKNVWDMDYESILKLDAGSGFARKYAGTKIPSLLEALKLCKGKIKLNIEIKKGPNDKDMVKKLIEMIEELDMEKQCIFSSTSYEYLKEIKGYDTDYHTGYIVAAGYGNYFDDENIDFFSVNSSYLSDASINLAHSYGKGIYAWTVNTKTEINRMKRIGADGIITDKPIYAREVLFGDEKTQSLVSYIKMLIQ